MRRGIRYGFLIRSDHEPPAYASSVTFSSEDGESVVGRTFDPSKALKIKKKTTANCLVEYVRKAYRFHKVAIVEFKRGDFHE